jgi:hypothetical protein
MRRLSGILAGPEWPDDLGVLSTPRELAIPECRQRDDGQVVFETARLSGEQ